MRIAIVAEVFLPKVDGVVNRTVHLIRELLQCRDEVMVLCPQAQGRGDCPVPVVEVPSFSFPLYPEYRIGLPDERLITALEQFRPDVLHYVNPFAFGFRVCDLIHRAGLCIPSVFSFHTLYGEFVKQYTLLRPLAHLLWWLTREYHNRAGMNLTVSHVTLGELERRGFQRVRFWPPAVDSSLFHPRQKSLTMRSRLTQGQMDRQLLLTVSRLAPEKNVAFLADVLDCFPNACLAVVGDGPQRAELERRFAGRNANFIGYLKGADLAAAYASADAFVYASETETMGNVVLEAMASGCAVVAPRAGGIPSLVSEEETALLYTPGDREDAIRATGAVLGDDQLRSQLGAAARAAVEGWNWEKSIDRVRQVYREAIHEFPDAEARLTLSQRLAQAVASTLVYGFKLLSKDGAADRQGAPGALSALSQPSEAWRMPPVPRNVATGATMPGSVAVPVAAGVDDSAAALQNPA
jgi:glycosyltransferase involved in cell wall biosynthesis